MEEEMREGWIAEWVWTLEFRVSDQLLMEDEVRSIAFLNAAISGNLPLWSGTFDPFRNPQKTHTL
jgi:hypothetical protein